jgi:hypothetical protein
MPKPLARVHSVAPAVEGKGKYREVPGDNYPPLAQGVVILRRTQHRKQAEELLDYINREDAIRCSRSTDSRTAAGSVCA